jgi:hypothetical protein
MGGPARLLLTLLAAVAATQAPGAVAAAADRFVPTDPGFVVADVGRSIPDDTLRGLIAEWRARPEAEAPVLALAAAFIERARAAREPRYFGRAEALLAPRARSAGSSAALRRLYAVTLQYRHAFAPAEKLFDTLLRENPRDADTRLRRASLRLTRGDFAGARADCVLLTTDAALASAGFACLAEALAGTGELARGRGLLDMMTADVFSSDPAARAYLLASRAELCERAGDLAGAIADYREASRLAPDDDAVRASLADALALNRSPDAMQPLLVDNPSLALLVRRAVLTRGAERDALVKRAQDWLALEAARGDASHHREAALLALADGRHLTALAEARRNFETQRELADVRVLARAVMSTGDAGAKADVEQWLRATGYQDAVTENILAAVPRR